MNDVVTIQPRHKLSAAVRRLEHDFEGNDPEWIAERAIGHVTRSEYRALLLGFIADDIRTERRRQERLAEQRAYRSDAYLNRKSWKEREAERALLAETDPAERRRRYPTLTEAIDDFRTEIRSELRLELTAELMATTFALHDGHRTSWGQATVDQHRERAMALASQGFGTLRTAALHEAAIELIEGASAQCLSEVKESQMWSGDYWGAKCIYRATGYNLFNDIYLCGVHARAYVHVARLAAIQAWNAGEGPEPFAESKGAGR